MPTATIRQSYEIVTYESALEGDAVERGWLDEDGTAYTFREAVVLLRGAEPSSSQFHDGVWYTSYGAQNACDGSYKNVSFHVTASIPFQRRLYRAISGV